MFDKVLSTPIFDITEELIWNYRTSKILVLNVLHALVQFTQVGLL